MWKNKTKKNKKQKKNIIIEKGELYPKYELKVTYESRKLDSSGKLFEGQVIFSKSEGSYLHTLLYKGKKRAVIFPSINSVKSQPLDLHHTVERRDT